MIVLFTLRCPNLHIIFDVPVEYLGREQPPPRPWLEKYMEAIMAPIRASKTEYQTCHICHAARSPSWVMAIGELNADTMHEAYEMLSDTGYPVERYILVECDDGEEIKRVNTTPLDSVH